MQSSCFVLPKGLICSLIRNRGLLLGLITREVIGRYRGSIMGLAWSFFNPILMLAVYTFFFSVVFKARWPGGGDSKTEFALILFSGLLVFNVFSECVSRAPLLIVNNVSYVKKIVFPLEILPIVSLGAAGFHFIVSFVVWLVFYLVFFGLPSPTIFLFPLVLLPLLFLILGISWFLASLGVFLRDVGQLVGTIIPVLMLISPVFFPVTTLPLSYRFFFELNPLTLIIEQTRTVLISGGDLDWLRWLTHLLTSILVAFFGYAWFQKTRKGFADVL